MKSTVQSKTLALALEGLLGQADRIGPAALIALTVMDGEIRGMVSGSEFIVMATFEATSVTTEDDRAVYLAPDDAFLMKGPLARFETDSVLKTEDGYGWMNGYGVPEPRASFDKSKWRQFEEIANISGPKDSEAPNFLFSGNWDVYEGDVLGIPITYAKTQVDGIKWQYMEVAR